ncbi:hypothetical protein [Lysinibacillus pakistanensis]|uniref:TMhelix containing protein n=1 Tax=Lysinibacillus pakistanensis TaxID=759811 RepID=A0AAX3X3R2_9BACI|nr:hypothetical protein [Lysinibacillus pakistanensis]MDM5233440.1 hypothetical protein [Lysinibacillus pakistanensis]WHY48912.1 hypothetical protein QNH22_12020 [Lysinibacillus pakistanensis]WHY53923.1 hypothetical protein QNH24_12000 [Lysinibacillus pakistanensis]
MIKGAKKVFFAGALIIIIGSAVLHYGVSDELEYKMCLGAQGISNTLADVFGDEPTNACNE